MHYATHKKEKELSIRLIEKLVQKIVAFSYAGVKLSTIVVFLGFNHVSTNWHELMKIKRIVKTRSIQVENVVFIEMIVLNRVWSLSFWCSYF